MKFRRQEMKGIRAGDFCEEYNQSSWISCLGHVPPSALECIARSATGWKERALTARPRES